MSLPVSLSGRAEADLKHQYRWYLDHANAEVAERFAAVVASAPYPAPAEERPL